MMKQLVSFKNYSFVLNNIKRKNSIFFVGAEAKKVFDDAQKLLRKIIDEKLLQAKGVGRQLVIFKNVTIISFTLTALLSFL
jgi:hypothetical protein